MKKKYIAILIGILICILSYFSYDKILTLKNKHDINVESKNLDDEFPIILEKHWDLTKEKDNDISIFTDINLKNNKEKEVLKLLLISYYGYDSFTSIETKTEEEIDGSMNMNYFYLNKNKYEFYSNKLKNNSEINLVESYKQDEYIFADIINQKKYIGNKIVSSPDEFKEFFFQSRISTINLLIPEQFSIILHTALVGNANITSIENGKTIINGIITTQESNFYTGNYELEIDSKTGIINEIIFKDTNDKEIYHFKRTTLVFNNEEKIEKEIDIEDFTTVERLEEIY
ncbi:hypothetical protein [Vagococcus fluvialis]|uniref:hypothetical protein n=1 Tax=Vagococcus fluvialis TaxID=2738 RepID=UPI003796021B